MRTLPADGDRQYCNRTGLVHPQANGLTAMIGTEHIARCQIEASADVWASVGAKLEAFANAWDSDGEPPDLAKFVPADSGSIGRLTLVELIKLDIDRRLQRGIDRPLEDYLQSFPELSHGETPCDLLYEDFHLRRQAGQIVDAQDYFRRFPDAGSGFTRLLASSVPSHSTSVVASAPVIDSEPGDRVDDFDLLALLGEGQFARVFLARQRSMQRLVALKISATRGAEAQTLAQLDHPHIVRMYDERVLTEPAVQLVYMSYLPGGTLQNVLNKSRTVAAKECSGQTLLDAVDAALDARGETPPPASPVRAEWANRSWPATVCMLGFKLAGALDYAHRRGVLHRDIKPANVLLTPEGEPLLADFNVGCCTKLEGAGPAAIFGGSLPYMAPEHLEAFNPDHPRPAESLDGRADVFSLAVMLWELLAGSRPFDQEIRAGSWSTMLAEIAHNRSLGPSPSAMMALAEGDVPGLRELLLRCLDADPNRRPATAGEMAKELALCLRPATRQLVRPAPGGWRAIVRRHPYWTLLVAGVVPNALASVFNIVYNQAEIIDHWPEAKRVFWSVIPPVNSFFFPLGLVIVALLMLPLARMLRRLRHGESIPEAELPAVRSRALRWDRSRLWSASAAGPALD